MLRYVTFNRGIHCLPKLPFIDIQNKRVNTTMGVRKTDSKIYHYQNGILVKHDE